MNHHDSGDTMKGGIIGKVRGDFSELSSFTESFTHEGFELQKALEVTKPLKLPRGSKAYIGMAAMEYVDTAETVQIKDGEITVFEEPQKKAKYTEFLAVPGEFVVAENSAGTFAFSLIGSQTRTDIERSEMDVKSFIQSVPESNPWKLGFYGHVGTAEKGVVYGQNLLDQNSEIMDVIDNSQLNQIGVEFPYKDHIVKLALSESGYLEIYQPSTYDSEEYLQFIKDEVVSYID